MISRRSRDVLMLGIGAFAMQAVAIATSYLLFTVYPATKKPRKRS